MNIINWLIALGVVGAIFFFIFRKGGVITPPQGNNQGQTAPTTVPSQVRWWDVRSFGAKFGGLFTPGGKLWSQWIRARVRVREVLVNWIAIAIILWGVYEMFPGVRPLYLHTTAKAVGVMFLLVGLLGVGRFRGVYGQVMCPKNYIAPALFVVAVIVLLRFIWVNLSVL